MFVLLYNCAIDLWLLLSHGETPKAVQMDCSNEQISITHLQG